MKKSKSSVIVIITTVIAVACLVVFGIRSLTEKIDEIEEL